jgi:N-hydroxyarylamine O-acetyltransferase
MDDKQVAAYLGRIGATRPHTADAAALRALHRAHLMTVPFENLSIHLGERISLDPADLIDKIVTRRRGGFCYELNGAFALLLQALGFGVVLAGVRVNEAAGLGPPFGHLSLLVGVPGAPGAPGQAGTWVADVGFGSHSIYPLRYVLGEEQADPGGRFLLAEANCGDTDVFKDGQPQYRIEPRPRSLADFVPTCWWQQTSPGSHFTQATICSRVTEDGKISVSGRTLIVTSAGSRTERPLASDGAVLAAYRDHFGIALDRVPAVPPG